MNNLYRDLLSNSPQTITIDIPTDMGTGQISQIVTKQGAVVSDWRMNYFSDIRQKIEDDRAVPVYIRTISNLGYQFMPNISVKKDSL